MITEDKIYPSKRGFIVYTLLAILIVIVGSYFFNGLYLPGILCLFLTGLVILPIVFNTKYTIGGNHILKVKCGLFLNTPIAIDTITKIVPTKTILSAPALSFDRLEVFYNKYDSVVISPENKEDFIARLQNINPAIKYLNKGD